MTTFTLFHSDPARRWSFRAQATTRRSGQSFPLLLTSWKRQQSGGWIPWLRRRHGHASASASWRPSEGSVLRRPLVFAFDSRCHGIFADCKNMPRLGQRTMICKFVSPIPCHPVPLSPIGCWQPCEPGLHFKIHKNGCGRVSANLTYETASIISCLRVPLNEYKFGRRGAQHHAFDEHISSKPAHTSRR